MINIFPSDILVGSHVPFSLFLSHSIAFGIENGMYIQVFIGDPKAAWKRQELTSEDIKICKKLIQRYPMNVFSHYPYCANLAGQSTPDGLAWKGNHTVDGKLKGVMKALEQELFTLASLRQHADHRFDQKNDYFQTRFGVVIHPGSHPDRESGHRAVAETLNRLRFPSKSVLLLENCAGEGNKLCRTFLEIRDIFDLLDGSVKNHVKVCVDTAHIWGYGDYDLRHCSEVDRMFDDFERELGLDNFYLLHLNDSSVPFGSRKDVHENLCCGYIWSDDYQSLVHLLKKCSNYRIPIVLETCPGDMLTISKLMNNNLEPRV
jgi:endonuclease IV